MTTESPPHDTETPVPYTIEQILSGVVMGLIVLITFGNVLARYFTSQSFAATEEFSIALLIVLSFLGSSAAFAFDRHIRVDFFVRKLPPGARAFTDWLSFAVTASLFAFIAFYAGKLTWDRSIRPSNTPSNAAPDIAPSSYQTYAEPLANAAISART